ncbi:3',5'-cyclic adenosine monophosphate phosphodiesterase CpdA [Saezia sanguinis]|uniref:3',5'-cyclic adenosine monophosphate phosphodiesterase CpdA n=1 Tax=Saezia sanguinis TaxID=1965230 RepID=A0A433SE50_9BURK|nr:phosphodiesterase [Saezia sanguinis]RUS66966.1 3',5'-cyclic adenosine monophosphate phosphodiesterase CpdA [Saezia sanguinis]
MVPEPIKILLQLSDAHIVPEGQMLSGKVDTRSCLMQAIKQIKRMKLQPSAVVITGDLVDDGELQSYAHLKDIISMLDMPVYVLPGNHDRRDHMLQAFPSLVQDPRMQSAGFIQYTAQVDELRLVVLDTSVPGKPHGELCDVRLDWLEDVLAQEPDCPTVVAMHHPPFKTGMAFMDGIRLLKGVSRLEQIIASNRQVQRVVCGHVHRMCAHAFGGTVAITTPSVAHQMAFQFLPAEAPSFTFESPGCLLHTWQASNVCVTSHLMALDDFAGPFSF